MKVTSHKILARNSKRFLTGASIFATCCCILPNAANANIINDTYGAGAGSFELGNFVQNAGADAMWINVGGTSISGWTAGGPGDGIDWIKTPTYGAMDGLYSVDLTHQTSSSISINIPTINGAVYDLSFGAAAYVTGINTGLVTAGSLISQSFTVNPTNSLTNQTFYPFSYQFTATSLSTTITFLSTNQQAGTTYGPILDNVIVNYVSGPSTSVPEPSSLSLMLIGLVSTVLTSKSLKQRKEK